MFGLNYKIHPITLSDLNNMDINIGDGLENFFYKGAELSDSD